MPVEVTLLRDLGGDDKAGETFTLETGDSRQFGNFGIKDLPKLMQVACALDDSEGLVWLHRTIGESDETIIIEVLRKRSTNPDLLTGVVHFKSGEKVRVVGSSNGPIAEFSHRRLSVQERFPFLR